MGHRPALNLRAKLCEHLLETKHRLSRASKCHCPYCCRYCVAGIQSRPVDVNYVVCASLGTLALLQTASLPTVGRIHHAAGIVVAIGIHAAIAVRTRANAAKILSQRI